MFVRKTQQVLRPVAVAMRRNDHHGPALSVTPCINPVATVSIATELNAATAAIWHELERSGVSTPYQSSTWYEAWVHNLAPGRRERSLIVTAFDNQGQATLMLPLIVRDRLGCRMASFAGGKHSNFNMPLLRQGVVFTPDTIRRLVDTVRRSRPDLDVLIFDSLPQRWAGVANPLVGPASGPHTATASLIHLDQERAHWPEAPLGHKSRKKQSASERRLANAGVTIRRARSDSDIDRALAAFADHKASWFSNRGLDNPFEEKGAMSFFAELAKRPASGAEIWCLHGSDDAIVATAAIITGHRRASLMFVSYGASSPLAAFSPGKNLVRKLVRDAAQQGFAVFDFGLGEAAYKTLLGAKPEPACVTVIPLTLKGRLAASLFHMWRRAKSTLKAHDRLLECILAMRRIFLFGFLLRASKRNHELCAKRAPS